MKPEPFPTDAFSLSDIDARLAERPFGNSEYICSELRVRYKHRLRMLSARIASAGSLLGALGRAPDCRQDRAVGDPIVRCAVHYAMSELETGEECLLPLEQCDQVFQEATRVLDAGECAPLGSRLVTRPGLGPQHGWIWNEECPDDMILRSFRQLVQHHYGGPLCTPSTDELAGLVQGERLLGDLLPRSSRSALRHAHVIALFPAAGAWANVSSSSQFALSGAIFLSSDGLSSPWWVAEHLFHEALHQQMYDFRHTHTLFDEHELNREGAARVVARWNQPSVKGGNQWSAFRTLAAFHVYVCTAVLHRVALPRALELEGTYGPPDGMFTASGGRTIFERAHYLDEQLQSTCWSQLGVAGKRFVGWFSSVLDALD
jgi:hypothetical protein